MVSRRGGALGRYAVDLAPQEVAGIQKSASTLRETLKVVLDRIGRVRK